MKNFYVFCLFFLFASQVKAQCPDDTIVLTSQEDIDNFSTTYPNCIQLKSNLRILSSFGAEVPIRSLSGISGITKVAGSISIENTELVNLQGLDNLVEIENTFHLSNNTALENLMGLAQLAVIGRDLSLFENPGLLNLTGLSNLTEVGRDFVLFGNTFLTSLAGMDQLTSIGGEFALVNNSTLQLSLIHI